MMQVRPLQLLSQQQQQLLLPNTPVLLSLPSLSITARLHLVLFLLLTTTTTTTHAAAAAFGGCGVAPSHSPSLLLAASRSNIRSASCCRRRASFTQLRQGSFSLPLSLQPRRLQPQQQQPSLQQLWASSNDDEEEEDDDDEDDNDYGNRSASENDNDPLGNGIDSVAWLPSVIGSKNSIAVTGTRRDAEILPLFPLGGIVYIPNQDFVLNIFEPRYRQMYSDILMNGSKRFVVAMSHPTDRGRFAQVGVLFELQDLKDVSDQTSDQIKYICSHRVTGRVKIHRVLNPEAWESRDTYLRVEGTITDDSGRNDHNKDDDDAAASGGSDKTSTTTSSNDVYGAISAAAASMMSGAGSGDDSAAARNDERALRESFAQLVDLQHDLDEDVRFTRASIAVLAVRPGPGRDGLWQTIKLWQSFADQRLLARQNELQKDFQEKLQQFLKTEKGLKEDEIPSAIGFQELSPELQQEVAQLQKRIAMELQPLLLESQLSMQKLLEAADHKERCQLLRCFIDAEIKRLQARKTLRSMFAGGSAATMSITTDSLIPREETMVEDADTNKNPSTIFTDEPDAFQ